MESGSGTETPSVWKAASGLMAPEGPMVEGLGFRGVRAWSEHHEECQALALHE